MKNLFRNAIVMTGATVALVAPALPAHAATFNAGTNACNLGGSSIGLAYSSTHSIDIYACVGSDSTTIQTTARIYNYGSSASYTVTAQLRRASDGALIASDYCQGTVAGSTAVYCTKAWPKSSSVVYATAVATRSPLSSQAIVSSPNYTVV